MNANAKSTLLCTGKNVPEGVGAAAGAGCQPGAVPKAWFLVVRCALTSSPKADAVQAPWLSAELVPLWHRLTLGRAGAGGGRKGVGRFGFQMWGDFMSSFWTALWGFPNPSLGQICSQAARLAGDTVQVGHGMSLLAAVLICTIHCCQEHLSGASAPASRSPPLSSLPV